MTTYTTTADENGNFTITLDTPLTNGEVVKVTAEKDGESKSINIQAPSEMYLPPTLGSDEEISVGFVVDFPMKESIFDALMNRPDQVLYSSKQLKSDGDLIKTISNKIPLPAFAMAYTAFKIPLSDVVSGAFNMSYDAGSYNPNTDSATYSGEMTQIPVDTLRNPTNLGSLFTADNEHLYFILNSNDMNTPNYCYKVIYNDVEYEARFSFQ